MEENPKFCWEATETQFFVDQENKMMLTQNPSWKPDGDNGKGDAIGRNFMSYFIYGDERFLEGIEACWEKVERKGWLKRLIFGKYYYQGHRYPHRFPDEVGLSRDHTLYTILAYKYAGYSNEFIKEFVTHLRFRISDFARFTPELWWWVRAMYGSKFYTWLYLTISLPVTKVSSWVNRTLYKFTGYGPESHQDDFIKVSNNFKPAGVHKINKFFYPIYALHQHAWQLYLLPDSKKKKKVQKAALTICPEHNYVIQMLLGFKDMVDPANVFGYKAMTGGRWTGVLNTWINDRNIEFIKDPKRLEWNVMDVDYVQKIYNTEQCIPIT